MSGRKGSSTKNDSSEKHSQALREIQGKCPENKQCFECRQRGPTYVDLTIGSFVCSKCSGVLRGITPPHRIKSISMSSFTQEDVESMRNRGNAYNAKVWLGLYDIKSRISVDTKDDESIREFIVQKYEKKRYYVDPSTIRHTVDPEPEVPKSTGTSLPSPPSKFSSGFIGSTLQSRASGSTVKPVSSSPSPPMKTTPPVASSNVKATPPIDKAAFSLSKSLANVSPAVQNPDPFSSAQPPTKFDPFGASTQTESFANFESANIYASPNPMTVPSSQFDFGFPPVSAPAGAAVMPGSVAAAVKPVSVAAESSKPIMSTTTEQEDRYAALKDLDMIFKSTLEVTKPTESNPPTTAGSNHLSNRSTFNPFATELTSSQTLNTSPWPLSASPSGPGFASASQIGNGQKDFFPSPWDTPAASAPVNTSQPAVDPFSTKNFLNPWPETQNSDNSFPAFGFNKKNPFL